MQATEVNADVVDGIFQMLGAMVLHGPAPIQIDDAPAAARGADAAGGGGADPPDTAGAAGAAGPELDPFGPGGHASMMQVYHRINPLLKAAYEMGASLAGAVRGVSLSTVCATGTREFIVRAQTRGE